MPSPDNYSYENDDRYVYSGTDVLVNRFGIRDWGKLSTVERALTGVRYAELEDSPVEGRFDLKHLCAIHRRLFGDVYPWAGKVRTRGFISKGNSLFCSPEFILPYSEDLFAKLKAENYLTGLDRDSFIHRLAFYIAEINALHPFREGNGRAQREKRTISSAPVVFFLVEPGELARNHSPSATTGFSCAAWFSCRSGTSASCTTSEPFSSSFIGQPFVQADRKESAPQSVQDQTKGL